MAGSLEKSAPRLDTLQRVELTEGVEIRLRTAGPMVRAVAILLDTVIQGGILFGLIIAFNILAALLGFNVGIGLFLIAFFLVFWFYFVFFEAGRRNATPGKRLMGLRVARSSGAPITLSQAVIRNFMRIVDFMPAISFGAGLPIPTYAFGLAACAFTRNFQRLGDLAANTVVIYNDPRRQRVPLQLDIQPIAPAVPLSREEQLAITDFLERISEWSDERRREMADILEPLTGATGEEGVRRLLGIGRWIRSDHQDQNHETF